MDGEDGEDGNDWFTLPETKSQFAPATGWLGETLRLSFWGKRPILRCYFFSFKEGCNSLIFEGLPYLKRYNEIARIPKGKAKKIVFQPTKKIRGYESLSKGSLVLILMSNDSNYPKDLGPSNGRVKEPV